MPYTAPMKNELKLVKSRSSGYCSLTNVWKEYWLKTNMTIEITKNTDNKTMYSSRNILLSLDSRRTVMPNSLGSFFDIVKTLEMMNISIETAAILIAQSKR